MWLWSGKRRTRGNRSYAKTVAEGSNRNILEKHLVIKFLSNIEDSARWSKTFIGEGLFSGETYNLQTHFEIEGVFLLRLFH